MSKFLHNLNKMVSIIIVNYNTKRFIIPCIKSIERFAPKDTEIIVVDNASTDGSVEELKTITKNLKLIANKENLGYAKAVNRGIKSSHGDYLFILNPDTKLTDGAVDELLTFSETHEDAGVVAPQLLNPDGFVQPSCYHEATVFSAIKEYFLGIKGAYDKYVPRGDTPTRVDAVVGAAMFVPLSTVKKVGLLDERFFMYFEDLDYCRRVRLSSLRVYYLPKARVYHEHGAVTRTVPEKARKWLINSSKIYHGLVKHTLLTIVLWLGQKWKRLLKFT